MYVWLGKGRVALFQAVDNIIEVQEIIHSMRHMKLKNGAVAKQIDLEKAYDRIRWDFLHQVLIEIGFPDSWIRLIMFIVSSNSFAVLWNKEQLPFLRNLPFTSFLPGKKIPIPKLPFFRIAVHYVIGTAPRDLWQFLSTLLSFSKR